MVGLIDQISANMTDKMSEHLILLSRILEDIQIESSRLRETVKVLQDQVAKGAEKVTFLEEFAANFALTMELKNSPKGITPKSKDAPKEDSKKEGDAENKTTEENSTGDTKPMAVEEQPNSELEKALDMSSILEMDKEFSALEKEHNEKEKM